MDSAVSSAEIISAHTSEPSALKWSRACFRISPFMEPSSRWNSKQSLLNQWRGPGLPSAIKLASLCFTCHSKSPLYVHSSLHHAPSQQENIQSCDWPEYSPGFDSEYLAGINNYMKSKPGRRQLISDPQSLTLQGKRLKMLHPCKHQ